MKALASVFLVFLLIGCGTASDLAPRPDPASPDDLQWLDTLRETDERSAALVARAQFSAAREELRAFADAMGHAHRKRTVAMDRWRNFPFASVPKRVKLLACVTEPRIVPPESSDTILLAALIDQRHCMLAYVEEARSKVQSPELTRIFTETKRTISAELQQLQTWSGTWTE